MREIAFNTKRGKIISHKELNDTELTLNPTINTGGNYDWTSKWIE